MNRSRLRFPWHLFVAAACLTCLGLSVSSLGDTYNFYFQKPKKEAVDEEEAESPPPAQTVTAPAATQPVVIHNVNNNNVGGQGQSISSPTSTGAMTPPSAAPAPPIAASPPLTPSLSENLGSLSASLSGKPSGPSRFRLNLVGTMAPLGTERWGGLVELGLGLTEAFWLNLYGGAGYRSRGGGALYGQVGADLEFMIFRLPVSERTNLIELGVLLGGSNLASAPGNVASAHGGARVNINFGSDFGLTGAGRVNLGYLMFEAGITARL